MFQWRSINNIIIAAPKTGVIRDNIRITKKRVIDKNGISTRRLRSPGADNVRLVIKRFVNDMVVLTPDNITLIMAISCAPIPVNLVLLENGVINVHPAIVRVELLALGKVFFLVRDVFNCVVIYHKESETFTRLLKTRFLIEKSKYEKPAASLLSCFSGVLAFK